MPLDTVSGSQSAVSLEVDQQSTITSKWIIMKIAAVKKIKNIFGWKGLVLIATMMFSKLLLTEPIVPFGNQNTKICSGAAHDA
jgi:hypothetical protein